MMTLKNHFSCSPSDISYELAYSAYSGISFSPEKRAKTVQSDYVDFMRSFSEDIFDKVGTSKSIIEDLEIFRERYIVKLKNYLSAKSAVLSPMITGPANFPVARNRKKIETEERRLDELIEFVERNKKFLLKKYNYYQKGSTLNPISSDDSNAIELLKEKVERLENLQEKMKKANSIVRSKKLSDDEQTEKLRELGFNDVDIYKMINPQCGTHQKGFQGFKLSNNNANIKTAKARIVILERKSKEVSSVIAEEGKPAVIVDNVEANRVQIIFEGKPSLEVRTELKSNGFRWSPRNTAWQAFRSSRSIEKAERIISSL